MKRNILQCAIGNDQQSLFGELIGYRFQQHLAQLRSYGWQLGVGQLYALRKLVESVSAFGLARGQQFVKMTCDVFDVGPRRAVCPAPRFKALGKLQCPRDKDERPARARVDPETGAVVHGGG